MRQGVNPEKIKNDKNKSFWHRIIIPVYIPNITEEYYINMLDVFEFCLQSVEKSINKKTTVITIINNNSVPEVETIIYKYFNSIDKYIKLKENKGKVYPVIHECRAAYEPFLTIIDSDVFLVKGWEEAVFEVFANFKNAGVVSPLACQGLAFNHNNSLFFDKFLFSKIKYEKVVSDLDCELYIKGLGNEAILNRNKNKYNWIEKQYFIEDKVKAIVGAGHFVATYRSKIFHGENSFPEMKFINGYEDSFIDILADKKGLYRLSTVKSFAYHMGNKMDDNYKLLYNELISPKIVKNIDFESLNLKNKNLIIPYFIKNIFFRIFKKILKL